MRVRAYVDKSSWLVRAVAWVVLGVSASQLASDIVIMQNKIRLRKPFVIPGELVCGDDGGVGVERLRRICFYIVYQFNVFFHQMTARFYARVVGSSSSTVIILSESEPNRTI